MGKSDTVKKLLETNQEFSQFMNEISKSAQQVTDQNRERFEKEIRDSYAGCGGKYIQLDSRTHEDYQVESEFSLAHIGDVIKKIGGEVFGMTNADPEKEEIIDAMNKYADMAVKIAVSVLSNVLSTLVWKQSAHYTSNIQHVSVAPGLTLHLMVVNQTVEGQGPLSSKKLIQNVILYQLNFSMAKARAQTGILYLESLLASMNQAGDAYLRLQKLLTDLITSKEYAQEGPDGNYHALANTYKGLMADQKASRDEAYAEVKKLIAQQAEADKQKALNAGNVAANPAAAPNAKLLAYLDRHAH